MKTKNRPAYLLALLPSLASAQDTLEELESVTQDRIAAASIIVDGSISPESIPFGEKMGAAFRMLGYQRSAMGDAEFRRDLTARYGGSGADAERISQYVMSDRAFAEGVHEQGKREYDRFCADFLSAGELMAAQEIGTRLMAIEDRRLARLEAHYRGAVDELGPSMRANFTSQIEASIVPGMTYGRIDYTVLAAVAPGFLREWITDSCKHDETEQPPLAPAPRTSSSSSEGRRVGN